MLPKSDDIGDRCKFLENKFTSIKVCDEKPVLCRIDGRAFHTFTKDFVKPFEIKLNRLMIETTKYLVKESNAVVGYTQSDEISLLWKSGKDLFFGGKIQKINSVLASLATAFFIKNLDGLSDKLVSFDSRLWQVYEDKDIINYFKWRQLDAIRNSVSMTAHAFLSHNEVQGKKTKELKEILFEKKYVDWRAYPNMLKFGTFVRNRQIVRDFTEEEIKNLPPKHQYFSNPELVINRSVIMEEDFPPLSKIKNIFEVIFQSGDPILIS